MSALSPTPQSSVTVDRLFAPAPHGLINDPQISYPAFRLWCVLHRLSWIKEPPEMERLCAEMRQQDRTPDKRSVYRWLSELESRGWLRWQRTPGKASVNRFLVLSERAPVTPESQPVIVVSQPVTPESQPVIVVSQAPPIQPRPEPPKKATQNHENLRGGGGGRAPDGIDPLIALFARYDITQAEPLARLYRDQWPEITIDQLTRLCEQLSEPDAGNYAGARLYRKLKAGPYEREQRPLQPDIPPRQSRAAKGTHNGTGGADLKDPGWQQREIDRIQKLYAIPDSEL